MISPSYLPPRPTLLRANPITRCGDDIDVQLKRNLLSPRPPSEGSTHGRGCGESNRGWEATKKSNLNYNWQRQFGNSRLSKSIHFTCDHCLHEANINNLFLFLFFTHFFFQNFNVKYQPWKYQQTLLQVQKAAALRHEYLVNLEQQWLCEVDWL